MTLREVAAVTTDRQEYGRYARHTSQGDLGKIVVTGHGIDGDPGDPLVFTLTNGRTGRVIARKVIAYDPELDDEESVTFDLETDCLDEFSVYRAAHGVYFARVAELTSPTYTPPDVFTDSDPFAIRIVTSVELQDRWLFGVDLTDGRHLIADDTDIPGVTVTAAHGIQEGGYPLQYVASTKKLRLGQQIAGQVFYGPPATLEAGKTEYVVWSYTLDGWITVRAIWASLPSSGTTAGYALLRPASLASGALGLSGALGVHLDNAAEAWQSVVGLTVPLEPWTVGTDIMVAWYAAWQAEHPDLARIVFDRTGLSPENWNDPKTRSRGPVIQLPGRRILKLHRLNGFYNSSPVLTIDTDSWWVTDPYNGNVSIVPSISARLPAGPTLTSFSTLFGTGFAWSGSYVANFWQFAFTHGLKDLWLGAGVLIREAIARSALLPIYLQAGRAAQGIYASENFNRDGVSLSRQYTSGQMGLYSGEIAQHDAWVKANESRIKRQIVGIVAQW